MNDKYKVIKEFECYGKPMVTVRIDKAAHVMSREEWQKICGRNHLERWETKVDWNRFVQRKQCGKEKVS